MDFGLGGFASLVLVNVCLILAASFLTFFIIPGFCFVTFPGVDGVATALSRVLLRICALDLACFLLETFTLGLLGADR